MAKEKTLLDEADEIAKEIAEEQPEEKLNGDFQRLMEKDVVLNPEIQDILTKENGRCENLTDEQKAEYTKLLKETNGFNGKPKKEKVEFT